MWQNIVVALVVLFAAGLVLRKLWGIYSGRGGSCGGCSKGAAAKPAAQWVELRGGADVAPRR